MEKRESSAPAAGAEENENRAPNAATDADGPSGESSNTSNPQIVPAG
jgi:hypothetical protein